MAPKHECDEESSADAYVAFFLNERSNKVIVQHKKDKICFPYLKSSAVPSSGEEMSECFSRQFENMCGTRYKLIFLYSTINEIYKISGPNMAMFEVISPLNQEQVLSNDYCWMSMDAVREHMQQTASSLDHSESQAACDQSALYGLERILRHSQKQDEFQPWELPKWHKQTTEEATTVLGKLGYALRGPFEQFSITPNAAVLTAESEKGRVYLKASNRLEAKVTSLVADFAPDLVQKPIYVNDQREWMIMNDYGTPMEDKFDVQDFSNLCLPLAKLHFRSLKHIQELKGLGIPCESAESLFNRTTRITEDTEFRRILGTCYGFNILAEDGMPDVRDCYEPLRQFLHDLYDDKKLPLSLTHGDLHRGNIIKTDEGSYVVFDWGYARIDIPLLDIMCLQNQVDSTTDQESLPIEPYFSLWQESLVPSKLECCRQALRLKVRLNMAIETLEFAKGEAWKFPPSQGEVLDLVYVIADIVEELDKIS